MAHPKEHSLATPIISLLTFRLLENNLLKIFLLCPKVSKGKKQINDLAEKSVSGIPIHIKH